MVAVLELTGAHRRARDEFKADALGDLETAKAEAAKLSAEVQALAKQINLVE